MSNVMKKHLTNETYIVLMWIFGISALVVMLLPIESSIKIVISLSLSAAVIVIGVVSYKLTPRDGDDESISTIENT